MRGEESIAALCRREGIAGSLHHSWSEELLEAGKARLSGETTRKATAPEVKELRSESAALKEVVAELTLENRLLKKHGRGWRVRGMRYPASEKLEIIRTVEASHLPTRQTLKIFDIPSSTYYDWYALWCDGGIDAPTDRFPQPGSVWNRIPGQVGEDVVDFALEREEPTPRELAVKIHR